MTIDIRHRVTCSLGRLISAQISDSYIQGSGLITTQGSCEIDGLITPSAGTTVTIQYTKDGITRTIPRDLRVLSSFADPFRRKTTVELGCKLTYLKDLRSPIEWPQPDEEEEEPSEEIPVRQITATSVALECLSKLGISALGLGLTNAFSLDSFDFSGGYVNVLSDLLVSESRFGFLSPGGILIVRSIGPTSTAQVIRDKKIIDISGIGSGQLPGDAVFVSYSSLKLRIPEEEVPPEEEDDDNASGGVNNPVSWTSAKTSDSYDITIGYKPISYSVQESTRGNMTTRTVTVTEGPIAFADYSIYDYRYEESQYTGQTVVEDDGTTSTKNLLTFRKVNADKTDVAVLGPFVSERLKYGVPVGAGSISSDTKENYFYDNKGREIEYRFERDEDRAYGVGNISLPTAFVDEAADGSFSVEFVPIPGGSYQAEKIVKNSYYYDSSDGTTYTKTVTKTYGPWIETISGQQAMARLQESQTLTAGEVNTFIFEALSGSHLLSVQVASSVGQPTSEEGPTPEEEEEDGLKEEESDDLDPNNGYGVESKSQIEFSTGNPGSTRVLELSMPYADDDRFYKSGSGEDLVYRAIKGNPEAKASLFGRTQNRLIFGNRYGVNVQLEPALMPSNPLSAIVLTTSGLAGVYLTNGTSWTISADGIIASTDALYWGVAGSFT